jgi:hypothetical protein
MVDTEAVSPQSEALALCNWLIRSCRALVTTVHEEGCLWAQREWAARTGLQALLPEAGIQSNFDRLRALLLFDARHISVEKDYTSGP